MANYNVDIALKVGGSSALDRLNKKLKEVEERQEQINKSTLLANNYLRPRAAAEKDFAKFKEKTIENNRKIAQQEQKILNIAKERASVEQSFLERNREDYKLARQKTAEFLKQQRLLLQMSRQYSGPIGPVASGATEFRRDKARRQRAQFIASGAPGVPVAGAQQALPAFRERGLQALNNSIKLNESQLRIETALNGQRQRGVRFLEAQSREEKRQLDLGIAGQRSNLIPGVSSGKAVPRTQHSRPIGPKPAGAGRGMAGGGNRGGQNLALGIGFPLLFGGGAGSVAGGALGSVGGMGGQVLGSAIGGIIDQTVANIAKLGQALNPLTADIGAVTAAAGESGTAFEGLVDKLEEVVGKEKALAVATAQLATVIGQDGVDALKEFGEETTLLGNEFAKTLSQISAAVADLINNSGLLTAVTGRMEFTRLVNAAEQSKDPTIIGLQQERKEKPTLTFSINEKIAARQKELELSKQLEISEEATAAIARKTASLTKVKLAVLEAENSVTQSGSSLLEEKAYQSARSVIFAQTRLAVKQAENDTDKIAIIMAEERNNLDGLRAQRAAQQAQQNQKTARKAEAARREADREAEQEERKRQQLATGLLGEYISQVDIISQRRQLGKTELVQLAEQRSRLELIYQAKVKQVEIATEDASLESAKLETLKQRRSLEIEQIQLKEKQIELEGRLNPLNGDPAVKGVRAGFKAGKEADEKLIEQAKELDALYKGIGGTIQTGIVDAIDAGIEGLINGTKDLGESLQEIASGVLRDIGKQLLSFGVKLGLQALTGGGGSFFAEGGYVTGPTNAVIGEGGEPEYIIPESKMRESMGRYSRGSRGSSVIPAEGGGATGAEGGTAVAAPIDVRYSVERINSVDYVTADQFQNGMKRAAAEGAQRGQQLTLSRLQQSPATRRRIGM